MFAFLGPCRSEQVSLFSLSVSVPRASNDEPDGKLTKTCSRTQQQLGQLAIRRGGGQRPARFPSIQPYQAGQRLRCSRFVPFALIRWNWCFIKSFALVLL